MRQIWGTIGAAVLASALTVAGMTAIGAASDPPPSPVLTAKEKSAAKAAPQARAGMDAVALAPVYQPNSETSFVPITPCRAVDTRAGTGTGHTRLGPGTTRTYYVGGTSGFAAQGGRSGGCGIPVGATAISATFIAVKPSGTGAFRAYANGQSAPTANVLNYAGKTLTGFSNVPINASSAYALKVANLDSTTDLVVDIVGYFVRPLAGMVSGAGTPYSGSSRIISGNRLETGVYDVQFDRDIRYCAATATAYEGDYNASTSTWVDSMRPDTVRVRVWDSNGVQADHYFYISVIC